MKNKWLKLLVTTCLITTLSNSAVFAKEVSNVAKPNIIESTQKESKNLDTIILEQGKVLSYQDFADIRADFEGNNKPMTDDAVKKEIVKRINKKIKDGVPGVTASYTVFGMNLNPSELMLVSLFPSDAAKAYGDAVAAGSAAESLYQSYTLYQGNGDAFRHTYWNGLMGLDIGRLQAQAFADAHEAQTPEGIDKTMDLNNNQTGRNLSKYCTRTTLQSNVINYVNNGWLHRIVDGVLTVTDSSGRR